MSLEPDLPSPVKLTGRLLIAALVLLVACGSSPAPAGGQDSGQSASASATGGVDVDATS